MVLTIFEAEGGLTGFCPDFGFGAVEGSRGGRVFEAFLVDRPHAFVGFDFALDEGLLVDVGPAEAEAEALDGVAGVGRCLREAVGLLDRSKLL